MERLPSREYFDEVSSDWDDMGESYFGSAPRDKIYSVLNLIGGEILVDVGCGTGYLAEALNLDRFKLIAIDQSEEMLSHLKKKFSNHPGLDLRTGHSEDLPVEENSVDVCMANMYLHHVEHPDVAIQEMTRIVKPGGTVVFTDMDSHDFDFLKEEQHDRWKGFERKDIEKWMNESGLNEVTVADIGMHCCAKSSCNQEQAKINVFIAIGTKQAS